MEKLNFKFPENKQVFLFPSGDKILFLLRKNKATFNNYSFKIISQPLKLLRESARKNVLEEALKFSSKFDPHIEQKINPISQF